jgi:hypothetical protein
MGVHLAVEPEEAVEYIFRRYVHVVAEREREVTRLWSVISLTQKKAELHKNEDSRRSYDIRTTGANVVCPVGLTMDRHNQYLVNIAIGGAFEIKITRPRIVGGTFLSNVLSVRVETNRINNELVSDLSVYDPRVSLSIDED